MIKIICQIPTLIYAVVMDVKVFKTFLEVTRTRHFGKAAENLYITQAAVSARIKQLEEFIGTSLFKRMRNNLTLTPAGERLLPYAETMVRALQQAKQGATLAEVAIKQLSFAGTPNSWDAYLQNYLTVITDAIPSTSFRCEIASSQQLISNITDNTVDVIVLFDPFLDPSVVSEKIADIDLVLVSTHPNAQIQNVLNDNYVYVDWGTQFAAEHSAKYAGNHVPALHTSTGRIALDYILAKSGSAYLPRALVTPFLESEQLFVVDKYIPMRRSVYAVYRKDNASASMLKQLVNVIDQSLPERPVILETIAASGDSVSEL